MKSPIEYLIGEEIKGLDNNGKIFPLQQREIAELENLSKKERALRFNGLIITDEKENILFKEKKRYSQHFFPLSIIDYAKALYNYERHKQLIPILSVDSHDVLKCDFRCEDCLSAHGTNFPIKKFPKDNFNMSLETYKEILREIAEYSEKRGFKGVRFEQSGEGNPDFYKHRQEILKYAKELQMQGVYISTGSKITDDLINVLIDNESFIRISFPGIGDSYKRYSRQKTFTYDDAIKRLSKIVDQRDKNGRKKDLMIGARVALRSEHGDSYFNFANNLKNIGIDALQIVKILIPEGRKLEEFPLNQKDISDLKKTATLDDMTFNVSMPHNLDYMVYSREIENRAEFPKQCFSAMFQPVLAGKSLFVCTISDIMYSHNLKLGTFSNKKGELEEFLSSENISRVSKGIPMQCKSCSNIYDNLLLFSLQGLFKSNTQKLRFYEVIK